MKKTPPKDIIEYLQNKWGDKVTQNFVILTYQIIELLALNPEMGQVEHFEKQIRADLRSF